MTRIVLETLPDKLAIHRLPASTRLAQLLAEFEPLQTEGALFATVHSRDELSIVCDAALPMAAKQEQQGLRSSGPWRALRVVGELDFALTGVLSGLAAPLAAAKISIFAISSFDTDYLLVKAEVLDEAVRVLSGAGYHFVQRT